MYICAEFEIAGEIMSKPRILYVSQEIMPYLPESEMAKMGRFLPQKIQEKGKEIRTFMPRYGLINERRHQLHEVIRLSGMNLVVDDVDHPLIIKVASIQPARMQVYFIDNEELFHRKAYLEDEDGKAFEDNDQRSIFFIRGVMETVKKLGWAPDIIHCSGFMTALLPTYLKQMYANDPIFANSKIVYSVFDEQPNGDLPTDIRRKVMFDGIDEENLSIIDESTYQNIHKLAAADADAVVMGSKEVNEDLKSYVDTLDKPVLEYQDEENYVDAYSDFYDQILSDNKVLAD